MPSYPSSLYTHTTIIDNSDYPRATHINTPAAEIVAIETELGTDVAGDATDLKTRLVRSLNGSGNLDFATSTELTIATGSITPTQNWHTVDTESDAASDDLDTIATTNVSDGFVLFLRANNTARTVVIKHNTGNVVTFTASDFTLDETYKYVTLIYDATLSKWIASMPLSTLNAGTVRQIVNSQDGAVSTGTTTVPNDDTIPQNTEGTQFLSQAITPTSATNTLIVDMVIQGASTTGAWIAALFQDTTANALAAVGQIDSSANLMNVVMLTYKMTAGTTSSTTFKVRVGPDTSGTFTFNGASSARKFGGVAISSLTITEVVV